MGDITWNSLRIIFEHEMFIALGPNHRNISLMDNIMGDDFLYSPNIKARLNARLRRRGDKERQMEQIKILNSTLARLGRRT